MKMFSFKVTAYVALEAEEPLTELLKRTFKNYIEVGIAENTAEFTRMMKNRQWMQEHLKVKLEEIDFSKWPSSEATKET